MSARSYTRSDRMLAVDRIASVHKFISHALTKLKSRVHSRTHTRRRTYPRPCRQCAGTNEIHSRRTGVCTRVCGSKNKNKMKNAPFRIESKSQTEQKKKKKNYVRVASSDKAQKHIQRNNDDIIYGTRDWCRQSLGSRLCIAIDPISSRCAFDWVVCCIGARCCCHTYDARPLDLCI